MLTAVWFRAGLLLVSILLAVRWRAFAALGIIAAGSFLPPDPAFWTATLGTVALGVLVAGLLLVGAWNVHAALAAVAVALLGYGGVLLPQSEQYLADLGTSLAEMRLRSPLWLILLLAVPAVVVIGQRKLSSHEVRPWVALSLRALGVAFLALALAEPFFSQASRALAVLFVVDRSLSIPEENEEDPANPRLLIDNRAQRVLGFINRSVEGRSGGGRDLAGLIVFGKRPRLELPPSDAPRFNLRSLPNVEDGNYTDIASALKLALASFPEGVARRVVLVSDGNENLGDAEEQARLAATLGVEIDVLPLASGVKATNEVMVEAVVAPPVADQGARVPIRVMVRSRVPDPSTVIGRLTVRQFTDARDAVKIVARKDDARVKYGLNRFEFEQPVDEKQRSYTYEAEFEPLFLDDGKGKLTRGLPGDRSQNNRASTHVVARGTGRILLLEGMAGAHAELIEKLASDKRFKVVAEPVEILENYKERDKLVVFLSNFDCVILANVPADRVSPEHMEVLRSNTHDQGCGLVMIGGAESFGAGGWQNTPVEKALPVDCEIKSLKAQSKGGLALIMHASEMADGNRWQKIIAKLAVERLGPTDEVGIIDFDFDCKWHVKLQPAGPNRQKINDAIDAMIPGDMPDFDPALKLAHEGLMDKAKGFGARHIIIISDGDPTQNDKVLLNRIKADKITIATVGVATHGAALDRSMEDIATEVPGGGGKKRYYKVDDPKKLPAIYIKETRLVSQSFVVRNPFQPILAFRTEPIRKLADLPRLGGFVRTTRKPDPLVEVPIVAPKLVDQEFPILAHWQYGLGKGVAFTSDAGRPDAWCKPWVDDGMFAPFWGQVLAWSLRPTESAKLRMSTERLSSGKIRIIVEAGEDDTDLKIVGGITPPTGKGGEPGQKQDLRFVQRKSGQYEAEAKADEAGSYFIAAQAIRKVKKRGPDGKEVEVEERDSVRSGVTLPYSPEFATLGTDDALLERLRETTGGRRYFDDEELLKEDASAVFRAPATRARSSLPFHYWLMFWAAGLLLADVAVRRLAFDAHEARELLSRTWARLRGQPLPPPAPERAGRLTARATPIAEPLAKTPAKVASAPPPPPPPPVGDTLDALGKAKRAVWDKPDGK